MVKQYQVVVDPVALRAQNLLLSAVREAIMHANEETVGSVLEMAEAEYMIRPAATSAASPISRSASEARRERPLHGAHRALEPPSARGASLR